jgi:hypothetical protein
MEGNCMKNKSLLRIVTIICCVLFLGQISAYAETNNKSFKINNTVLEFKEIIYVDGSNGDDVIGDGSKNKPFKTVVKGFDHMSVNCREGGAIVIKDGTYDVGSLFNGTLYNLNKQYNGMKISILAETMGKVEFTNVGEWIVVENSATSRIKINFYGVIFKSISQQWYCLGGDDWTNEYYNCVFVGGYGGWNYVVKSAKIKVENSLFIGPPGSFFSSTPLNGSALNCASTTQHLDPANGTKTNNLYNATIDSGYNVTSIGWENSGIGTNPDGTVAHVGVYGGSFAWGYKGSEIKNILKVVLEINEKLQLSVDNDLGVNVEMTWTSSDNTVATVNEKGIVTALAPGNTIITVKSADGSYTDYINVLVVENADDYRLAIDLKNGETARLTVDDFTNTANVTWAPMDSSIANVTNKGKVTALNKGLVLVSAKDADGNIIGRVYVRVRE